MPKMSTSELKAMLTAEKLDALAAMRASKLSSERAHAMDYYNCLLYTSDAADE